MNTKHNILLITPKFYGYDTQIYNNLKKRGFDVDLVYLHVQNMIVLFIFKILAKISYNLYEKFYNCYYFLSLKNKKYDKIIVISGETLSRKVIRLLKTKYLNEDGEIILYIWTPISRYQQLFETIHLYEKVFSFQQEDCKKHGFIFLPNFYSSTLVKQNINERERIFFVGQYRKERYQIIKNLKHAGIPVDAKIYHSKMFYYIFKVLKYNEYKFVKKEDLIFKPLNNDKVNFYMNSSKAILDIVDKGQTGLSQRPFDCLYLQKKIITTSKEIKNYNFYNENNIYILKLINKQEIENFMKKKYDNITDSLCNNYSLDNWLNKILED